jgi:hypothetical protein
VSTRLDTPLGALSEDLLGRGNCNTFHPARTFESGATVLFSVASANREQVSILQRRVRLNIEQSPEVLTCLRNQRHEWKSLGYFFLLLRAPLHGPLKDRAQTNEPIHMPTRSCRVRSSAVFKPKAATTR